MSDSLKSSGNADKRGEQIDDAALDQRFSCHKTPPKRSNRFETSLIFWQINRLSWCDPVGYPDKVLLNIRQLELPHTHFRGGLNWLFAFRLGGPVGGPKPVKSTGDV